MSKLIDTRERKEESWYQRDGTPVYDANLRDARKQSLFPRVSTILSVWPKPDLQAWKTEQTILAALSLPRQEGEPLEEFAKRIVEDSRAEATRSAEWGSQFHALVEAHVMGEPVVTVDPYAEPFRLFAEWYNGQGIQCIGTEEILVNPFYGYAGRMDLLLKIGEDVVLADVKTRSVKGGKPAWYDEQAMQLAAYSHCLPCAHRPDLVTPQKHLSIVVNRDTPEPPYLHWWDKEEMDLAWERFKTCRNLWMLWKKYNPVQEPATTA